MCDTNGEKICQIDTTNNCHTLSQGESCKCLMSYTPYNEDNAIKCKRTKYGGYTDAYAVYCDGVGRLQGDTIYCE